MPAEAPIRFVADGHVGKLARYLRMLGFDTLYNKDFQDEELIQLSVTEGRVLLTQDRKLVKRKEVTRGYLVRESDPRRQLESLLFHFNLHPFIKPFERCLLCNTPLESISKAAIQDRLPPKTRELYQDFWVCPGCRRIYWMGAHYERMRAFIDEIVQGK
jgi:uncharacterized protein with PIN domain